ncbi:MAG: ATP-binding protein [Cellvibrionaceae bacterium]|nr:ATP-binding protein [Cellvibrionaceae bacterium]MCV6627053.1 ATP-binding protein [Cellvibrionaceae bacterium]
MPASNKLPLRRRLAYKQTRNIVLVAFVIGLLLTGGQLLADYFAQRNMHSHEVQKTLATAIKSAQFAAYNLDDATSAEIVAGLLNNRFIIQATILDNYGDILATASKPAEPVSPLGRYLLGELQTISTNLKQQNTIQVGTLNIQVDPASRAEEFIQRSLLTFVFGIVRNIVLAVCIMLVFYYGLTKSILSASAQVSRAESIDEVDIPAANLDDEIGMLLKAFNRQLQTIKAQHRQIIEANKTLETQVAERTAELKTEQQAALAASQAKSDFLAVMSHEIRTPMNGILGLLRLLADSGLPQAQAQYVDTINEACESLLGLMNNALEYTRNEQGRLELINKVVELDKLLASLMFLLNPAAKKSGSKLSYHVAAAVPQYINTDPDRLRQVILNLLNNAIKFTRAGEIHLEVSVINDLPGQDQKQLHFKISDTGVGIAKAAQQSIFTPYKQADKKIHAMYGGAGMGLAICKTIVDKMGGNIDFHSVEGEGSEFWFDIPLQAAKAPRPKHTEAAAGQASVSVLLADDVAINLKLANWYFAQSPHHFLQAENGREAVAMVAEQQPEVVLMDVNMPVLDGIEATRQLRQQHYLGLIYGVTAHSDEAVKQRCYQAGMDAVVEKPLDYPQLMTQLQSVLARQCDTLDYTVVSEHFSNLGIEPASQLYDKALDELAKNIAADAGVAVGQPLSYEQLHKLKGLAANFGLRAMLELFTNFNEPDNVLTASCYQRWLSTMRMTQLAISKFEPKQ